ncbi:MAG: hypothetical protein AAGI44_06495 [Pseudomonadota bacterium]
MMIDVIVLVLLLALLIILLPVGSMWSSFKLLIDRVSRPRTSAPSDGSPAISVLTSPDCCGSAQRMQGKRYPSSEAPGLPLADCTQDQCSCTYGYANEQSGFHVERRRGSPRAQRMLRLNNTWLGISGSRRSAKSRSSKGAIRIS